MNTHYALITFSGDPAEEHPDEELRGKGPSLELIAAGNQTFCWQALADWTKTHPLKMWQTAEVVARDPLIVHVEQMPVTEPGEHEDHDLFRPATQERGWIWYCMVCGAEGKAK